MRFAHSEMQTAVLPLEKGVEGNFRAGLPVNKAIQFYYFPHRIGLLQYVLYIFCQVLTPVETEHWLGLMLGSVYFLSLSVFCFKIADV